MTVQLFELPQHPSRIAVSEVGSFIPGGSFFLDFSRPLETHRWLGVRNRWVGVATSIFVPIVHEAEAIGGYVVGVERTSPCFAQLRDLWRQRYPSKNAVPSSPADHLRIVADFANQFPGQV
jgi:hypothetical protein